MHGEAYAVSSTNKAKKCHMADILCLCDVKPNQQTNKQTNKTKQTNKKEIKKERSLRFV
jgi:hypothetical protein